MEIGEEVSSTSENGTKVSPCEDPVDVDSPKKPIDAVPESIVESTAEKPVEDISSPRGIKINGDLNEEDPPSPKIVDLPVDSDNASAISSSGSNACSDVPDSSVTSSEPEPKLPDQIQSDDSDKPDKLESVQVNKPQSLAVSDETQAQPVSSETQSLAISSPTVTATSISSPKEQAPIVTCTKSDKTELSLESLQNSSRTEACKKDGISLVEKLALNSSITVSRKESKPEPKAESPPPEGRVLRLRPIPKPEPPKILSKPSKPIESRKTSTSSNSGDKSGSKPIKSQKRKHDDVEGDSHDKVSTPIQYRGFKKLATVKEPVKKSIIKFNPFNPAFRRDCSTAQMVCSNFDSSLQPEYPPEYQPESAQYLGLRPLVKFRCSNCGMSSFESMNALNAHKAECTKTMVGVNQNMKLPYATGHLDGSQDPKSANIKFTRKVFLCSACGTYYELWNLFLHMREAHRRYICLQCLGMSSSPEKLSEHLKLKHDIQAQVADDTEKFAPDSMPQAFYLLCIACDKIYSEADKFASHKCQGKKIEEVAGSSKSSVVSSQTQTSELPAAVPEVQSQKQPLRRTREATKKANKLAQVKKETEAQKTIEKETVLAEQVQSPLQSPDDIEVSVEQIDSPVNVTREEPNEPLPEVLAEMPPPDTLQLDPGIDSAQSTVPDSVSEPPKEPEENTKPETTPDEQLVAEELAEMAQIIGASVAEANSNQPLPPADPEVSTGGAISKVKVNRRGGPRKPTRKRKPLTFKPKPRKPKRVHVPILPLNPSGLLPNHLNSVDYPSEEPPLNSVPENPPPVVKSPTKSPTKTPSHEFLNKLPPQTPNIFKLKLNPDMDSENDSDDSQKLSLVVDESANNSDAETKNDKKESNSVPEPPPEDVKDSNEIVLAGEDIQPMALTLDDKIENIPIQLVLKECVRTSCLSCNYCRHAHKIAVNGKYLALHLLSEHRYMPIKNETPDDVVNKLKTSLEILENMCFNSETYDNTDSSIHVPYDQDTTFDCFQCNFYCKSHKDLFAHKRKFHSKPLLLCIMCKTNFFSYSEMLCHLCPGHYKAEIMFHNVHISFRCCFCRLDSIPSAFRLMVHLRKSHHTCDICLESCSDQQKLSTHLWKHKVNHLCYRCGISYASKPDITKHLFWKHGHESVLCKKCLQKKWPHVYHFCIPPTSFICEECSATFSKAVALKVHKRVHAEEFPYACGECEKKFISKKSLLRHEERHRNIELNLNGVNNNSLPEEDQKEEIINVTDVVDVKEEVGEQAKDIKDQVKEKSHKKHKKDKKEKVVDLYDLPPLNLSSDSDSSDGEDTPKKSEDEKPDVPKPEKDNETMDSAAETGDSSVKDITEDSLPKLDVSDVKDVIKEDVVDTSKKTDVEEIDENPSEEKADDKPSDDVIEIDRQVEGIWENFYKTTQTNHNLPYPLCAMKSEVAYGIIMGDHDYCIPTKTDPVIQDDLPTGSNLVQGFSDDRLEEINMTEKPTETPGEDKKKAKSPKKKVKSSNDNDSSSSSDSSSDSDSSSCTCGTNCSCSSSSSNSSSSSSSDSESSGDDKAKQERRKKKKERKERKKSETVQETVKEEEKPAEPEVPRQPVDPPPQESELETDESSTDEEFYDKQPGKIANQIIAEKRNQLILSVAPVNNGAVAEPVDTPAPTKGSPTKHRVKEKKRRRAPPKPKTPVQAPMPAQQTPPAGPFAQFPRVTTPNMSFGYGSPNPPLGYSVTPSVSTPVNSAPPSGSSSDADRSRSSKRRRIPNKFYGYSSGEEEDARPMQKWRKPDVIPPMPRPQLPPPPMAIPPPNTPRIQLTVPKQIIRKPSYHKVQKTPKITIAPPPAPPLPLVPPPPPDSSETDSDADVAASQGLVPPPLPQYTGEPSSSKPEKDVYCYCRCPYDEVSEMIACDDETCPIEWFHFECVGIMVPPRGQWYCPGCRKARGLPT